MSAIKLDMEKRRVFYINMPLTLAEKQQLVQAALERGLPPAVYCRMMILQLSLQKETAA